MKKSETIESTKHTAWGIWLVKLAMRTGSIFLAYWALSHLHHGRYGKALVDAALCLLYMLVASFDLDKLWASRHSDAMALAKAERPTLRYMATALLIYIFLISGIIVQCLE